jgi:benzodiazapine receptor
MKCKLFKKCSDDKTKFLYPFILLFSSLLFASFFLSAITNTQSEWFTLLDKPSFYPPSYLFSPVWIFIYALISISFSILWNISKNNDKALEVITLFIVNLILNISWTLMFFGTQNEVIGYTVIVFVWGTLLLLILKLQKFSRLATYLLIPYVIWVTFASYLNYTIVLFN